MATMTGPNTRPMNPNADAPPMRAINVASPFSDDRPLSNHGRMDERAVNFVEHGPQNSRGFRALKVWLALKQVGASGYRQMIADDIRLARAMADHVDEHPELELMTQSLSITTFRYVPADLSGAPGDRTSDQYLDALNQELLDSLQRGGEVFVSNAVIGGRYALRACIVNFHTTAADVEALPLIVAREGRSIDARLRPTAERS